MWLTYYIKGIAVGSLFAFMSLIAYTIVVSLPAHRRGAAIGAGAWQAWTVHSPWFWLVLGISFVIGTFVTLRVSTPPMYR
jgi:hypothetical protein